MSAPSVREYRRNAAVHVRTQRSMLQKHWLSAAFVFLLVGVSGYMTWHLYGIVGRLEQVRSVRTDMERQLGDARRTNTRLASDLNRVTDDSYMELMAKAMGFVYPQEAVYQPSQR